MYVVVTLLLLLLLLLEHEHLSSGSNKISLYQDVPSCEQRKNRQHSMHIDPDAIKQDVYDTTKEYAQHSNVLTWACGSDHINGITIDGLVDSLKSCWTKKAIANFLIPNLEKYGEESLKEICSLLKGECCIAFNFQVPASTIVMPVLVNSGDKKFAAAKGKNSVVRFSVKSIQFFKIIGSTADSYQAPLDQADQLGQRRQVVSEHPTSTFSEGHDHFSIGKYHMRKHSYV